jgi:hypothetical protein
MCPPTAAHGTQCKVHLTGTRYGPFVDFCDYELSGIAIRGEQQLKLNENLKLFDVFGIVHSVRES